MRGAQSVVLVAATLCTGLMAGLFAAFSYSVMPGLGRGSDRTFVEAMQGINKAILNPWFMVPFMGSVPLLVAGTWLAWKGNGRSVLPWVAAALVLYVVAFIVTSGVNVPLNDALEKAGEVGQVKDLGGVRSRFEDRWVAFNVVRAVLHTVAFGLMVWALVLYGRATAAASAAGRVAGDAAAALVSVR